MKYDFKRGQYIIEIDIERGIVIIEDLFEMVFKKKILLNINKNILSSNNTEDILKEKINLILGYDFEEDTLMNMLELSVEDNENNDNVFKLGSLKIEDYGLYYTKKILEELNIINDNFCFIGGQILRFYGVNRQTSDTDILILADNSEMNNILEKLEKYSINIEHVNIDNGGDDPIGSLIRFIYNGVEIDILATKYKFQDKAVHNSTTIKLSNNEDIKIISLTDLIIFKIYGNSYKDFSDVDALIKLNFDLLTKQDIIYIKETLNTLRLNHLFSNFFPNE